MPLPRRGAVGYTALTMRQALRLGLVGCGRAAGRHVSACRQIPEMARVVAVCDVSHPAALKLAGEAGAVHVFDDPRRLIDCDDVDAVVVAVPHELHAAVAAETLRSGRHVLMEKPLGCCPNECRAVAELAGRSDRVLMLAMNHRFSPAVRAAVGALNSGAIGAVRSVRMESLLDAVSHAPAGHWIYDGWRGGGVLLSLTLQQIDLIRHMAGEVEGVASARLLFEHPNFINDAAESAEATLSLAGGRVGSVRAALSVGGATGESLEITGECGRIYLNPLAIKGHEAAMITDARGATSPLEMAGDEPDGFVGQMRRFVACCRGEDWPAVDAADAQQTMAVIWAIAEAAGHGHVCPPICDEQHHVEGR